MALPQLHPDGHGALGTGVGNAHLDAAPGETLSEILATVPIEILTCIVRSRVEAGRRFCASAQDAQADAGVVGEEGPMARVGSLPGEMRWCIPAKTAEESDEDLALSARLHYQEVGLPCSRDDWSRTWPRTACDDDSRCLLTA